MGDFNLTTDAFAARYLRAKRDAKMSLFAGNDHAKIASRELSSAGLLDDRGRITEKGHLWLRSYEVSKKLSKSSNGIVFAKWVSPTEKFDKDDLHISCGADGDQYDGYFADEKGSKVAVKKRSDGQYDVILTAPSKGLEKERGYWLSPSLLNDNIEAVDFGIKNRPNSYSHNGGDVENPVESKEQVFARLLREIKDYPSRDVYGSAYSLIGYFPKSKHAAMQNRIQAALREGLKKHPDASGKHLLKNPQASNPHVTGRMGWPINLERGDVLEILLYPSGKMEITLSGQKFLEAKTSAKEYNKVKKHFNL